MSKFVRRWAGWDGSTPSSNTTAETSDQGTCKTSKTPFAGFAGSLPGDPSENPAALENREEGSMPTCKTSKIPNHEDVAGMDLDTFARAGLIVQVSSRVLGCEVLLASDNVPDAELEGTDIPIYRTDELRKLVLHRPRPRDLRRIHDVKTIFNGAITDVQPRDHHAGRSGAMAHRRGA